MYTTVIFVVAVVYLWRRKDLRVVGHFSKYSYFEFSYLYCSLSLRVSVLVFSAVCAHFLSVCDLLLFVTVLVCVRVYV